MRAIETQVTRRKFVHVFGGTFTLLVGACQAEQADPRAVGDGRGGVGGSGGVGGASGADGGLDGKSASGSVPGGDAGADASDAAHDAANDAAMAGTWSVPEPTFVAGSGASLDLRTTLPAGTAPGGTFSVDPSGPALPTGMSLSAIGLLAVGAATPGSVDGVVFRYTV